MSLPKDASTLWLEVLATLNNDPRVTPQSLGFFSLVEPKGIMLGSFYLEVPNDFTRDQLNGHLRIPLLSAFANVEYEPAITNFSIVVNETLEGKDQSSAHSSLIVSDGVPQESPNQGISNQGISQQGNHHGAPASTTGFGFPQTVSENNFPGSQNIAQEEQFQGIDSQTKLNPKYIFENFVIGGSNRMTHAAAVAVAEAPAKAYNPLFIYGNSGLGKTHLLHAIGNYAQTMFQGIQVRYISSEEFTNDFINSVQNNQMPEFQDRYRNNVDILMIDDIQFLAGKEETQENFFHIFNALHSHNKQIVITSDQHPKQLTGFTERMLSRFVMGLPTDVQTPDLETRIAILRKKAINDKIDVPYDVLEFIAERIYTNIRELEGTLIRVTAWASLNKQPIDIDLVKTVLHDVIALEEDNMISPTEIINVTAEYFKLSVDDLSGSSRSQAIALARQIAMYLCREHTNLSLPKIGQLFGNRDHTTVMYANRKITSLMSERRSIYNNVTELTSKIRNRNRS